MKRQCDISNDHVVYLIALYAVLFNLVKLALQFSLSLGPLLCSTNVKDFPRQIFSIHLLHGLRDTTENTDKEIKSLWKIHRR